MSLSIIQPGLLTTLQDAGRWGYQKEGIPVSGAMDLLALRIANLLVGNPETSTVLEICIRGPKIRFEQDQLIAITGASLAPKINENPIKCWHATLVKRGSLLSFGAPASGQFAYLAVAGGFNIPQVLRSSSTYLKAGLGGYQGRALQAGDQLPCHGSSSRNRQFLDKENLTIAAASDFVQAKWAPAHSLISSYNKNAVLRIMKGPEWDWFDEHSQQRLWKQTYRISNQSDRMGYRLEGTTLSLSDPRELLSTAVAFGTIQVPSDGKPIVLLADHQTTGGYPRIGQLASVDFSTFVQQAPGKWISFREISLQESQQLYLQQEQQLNLLKRTIQLKYKHPI